MLGGEDWRGSSASSWAECMSTCVCLGHRHWCVCIHMADRMFPDFPPIIPGIFFILRTFYCSEIIPGNNNLRPIVQFSNVAAVPERGSKVVRFRIGTWQGSRLGQNICGQMYTYLLERTRPALTPFFREVMFHLDGCRMHGALYVTTKYRYTCVLSPTLVPSRSSPLQWNGIQYVSGHRSHQFSELLYSLRLSSFFECPCMQCWTTCTCRSRNNLVMNAGISQLIASGRWILNRVWV